MKRFARLQILLAAYFVLAVAALAAERPSAIKGAIVTTEGAHQGWVIFNSDRILRVTEGDAGDEIPADALRFDCSDCYIYPGLIDCHNHVEWNVIPKWRPKKTYQNRYQMQKDGVYVDLVEEPYHRRIENEVSTLALEYGELRALFGGTTIMQSSYRNPPPPFLIRNLDSSYGAKSRVLPSVTEMTLEAATRLHDQLARHKEVLDTAKKDPDAKQLNRFFVHAAEGLRTDENSRYEFYALMLNALACEGVVVIHGVPLDREDFQAMKARRMYLVWSPKSNLVLYGETARVEEAVQVGLKVALAPDWGVTGSDNVLAELRFAYRYAQQHHLETITPNVLFRMVTVDAAEVAGLKYMGTIAVKNVPDFFVAKCLDSDPFISLLRTEPSDVQLVFVEGKPVYGDYSRLAKLYPLENLNPIDLQVTRKGAKEGKGRQPKEQLEATKAVYFSPDAKANGALTLPDLRAVLSDVLADPAKKKVLADLIEDDPDEDDQLIRRSAQR